jgi:hypothetical protein
MLCSSAPSYAIKIAPSEIETTGFATLAYTQANKYRDLSMRRNTAQNPDTVTNTPWLVDSRLGLQSRAELSDHWDSAAQIIFKNRIDDSIEDLIHMAFVRYHAASGLELSFGRMALDTFSLSDHRDVGYSYHWVRPPVEFYGWIPFSSYDGIKSRFTFGDYDSAWTLEAFAGRSRANIDLTSLPDGHLKITASPFLGAGIQWQGEQLSLRLNINNVRFSNEVALQNELVDAIEASLAIWPEGEQIQEQLEFKNSHTRYSALGLKWMRQAWMLQAEYSHISANKRSYAGDRAYISLSYRWQKIQPHLTYSRSWDNRTFNDPLPQEGYGLEPVVEGLKTTLYTSLVDQYTVSAGLRWDFSSTKAFKLQCDRSTFSAYSTGILLSPNDRLAATEKTWCSAALDWVF